jgi:hypothetical protein
VVKWLACTKSWGGGRSCMSRSMYTIMTLVSEEEEEIVRRRAFADH